MSQPCFNLFRVLVETAALQEQRTVGDSTVGESSPIEWKEKYEENYAMSIPQASSDDDSHPGSTPLFRNDEFHIESRLEVAPVVEHQFITRFSCESQANQEERESERRDECAEDISVSLQLGEPECKKRKLSASPLGFNNSS